MTTTLVTGIAELVTNDPQHARAGASEDERLLGLLTDAAIVVEDDRIAWVGEARRAPDADRRVDVDGAALMPGFVDSHAHLVFDGDRSAEFAARMAGERYDGGGIATTVAATRDADDDRLTALVARRIAEMRAQGTTCVEVKSGYGLTVEDEARALRIAREFTPETTYLGAHVVPSGSDRAAYVDLVCGEMLEACRPYARWADVFCEPGSA
ncbi:MAG: imidazolonepropionase, partial [Dermacoccus nishinomiyaensis]